MEFLKQQRSSPEAKQHSPLSNQDSLSISPSPANSATKTASGMQQTDENLASNNNNGNGNNNNLLKQQSTLQNLLNSQSNIGIYMPELERQQQNPQQLHRQLNHLQIPNHHHQIPQNHMQNHLPNYQQISQPQSFMIHSQHLGFIDNENDNSGDEEDEDDDANEALNHQNCKFFNFVEAAVLKF